MNHRFFQGGCLFELVRASQKREVLSVGGRSVYFLNLHARTPSRIKLTVLALFQV